jgi:transcriptional regulator with XRE-family HTH domain
MGMTLKALREQAGKTCSEVAKTLGVTVSAICNYESGIRRLSVDQLIPLAKFYEVSVDEVVVAQLNSCQ